MYLPANQQVGQTSSVFLGCKDCSFNSYLVNDGIQGCIYHHNTIFHGFYYMVRSIHSSQLLFKVLCWELADNPKVLKISPTQRDIFFPKAILITKHFFKVQLCILEIKKQKQNLCSPHDNSKVERCNFKWYQFLKDH